MMHRNRQLPHYSAQSLHLSREEHEMIENKVVAITGASSGIGEGDSYAMSPNAVAAAIAHAIEQPEDVTIGEIVVRSRNQP
jgi:NADP-dependent 3-hydroxy acid dehydrogenase YdfG